MFYSLTIARVAKGTPLTLPLKGGRRIEGLAQHSNVEKSSPKHDQNFHFTGTCTALHPKAQRFDSTNYKTWGVETCTPSYTPALWNAQENVPIGKVSLWHVLAVGFCSGMTH